MHNIFCYDSVANAKEKWLQMCINKKSPGRPCLDKPWLKYKDLIAVSWKNVGLTSCAGTILTGFLLSKVNLKNFTY